MTNVVQAIQTTLTYSNLAFQLITGEVNDIASRLNLPESLPVQSAPGFNFKLKGKTAGIAATVETEKFEYEFDDGAIQRIWRNDSRRHLEPQSPLLMQLTNEVLILKKSDAEARAFEILSDLSFDIEKLKKFYDVKVHDDLLTLSVVDPTRTKSSGSSSTRLMYSHKKIQIEVAFTRKGTDQSGPNFKFIATTGDLLSLFIWDSPELKRLGIFQKQLLVADASDLSLPVFFTGKAVDSTSSNLEESKIVALVRDAVTQVQQNVGINNPKGFLVCDNLNAPELVARELKNGLTNAFFAGVSTHWRTDLPFSREQQDAVSKDKRGIYIVGFSGNLQTEFQKFQVPEKRSPSKNKTTAPDDRESSQSMEELFSKLQLPQREKTLFVSLGNSRLGFPSLAFSEAATERGATVFPGIFSDFNPNYLYWNGDVESNSWAFLRISGELPFSERGIDFRQFERLVRTPFDANPLEEITDRLGPDTIQIMRQAKRVETIRIRRIEEEDKKARLFDDYVLIGTGQPQGTPFTRALSEAIINEKNGFGLGKMCIFDPGVIFRLWRGKEMVKVTICFNCEDMAVQCFDRTGVKTHSTFFDFSANRAALVRLCKRAFPKDGGIQILNEKD
jgi:hypothetical protein